ncbi:phospholipase D-like domain-containing protein [Aureispira anguillae]|uniref:Phospholipase D-like domain-containing protein n=1 Tax=Aureispira anguillae TaxID=2864201 RepID=A0A915YGM3_9BACT|nr:hypothetical protein [Aureispira anguillae]BDS12728.1 hypothetical protein AsAng_0034530 [Aureispira anguillae]
MELIQPAEISGKIMTLIDQAKEELIIVSPYNKFTAWKKLTQRINKAQQRGIKIKWYIRKNIENNVAEIRQIGIEPIEVENLHCKIYLNEQNAVVTSMNLHQYSDSSSIDIGYLITQKDKYEEIIKFIDVYIHNPITQKSISTGKISHQKGNSDLNFIDSLVAFFTDLGYEEISNRKNKFGPILFLSDFFPNFDLIFEPKGCYYRIDLRINYPYKKKRAIYDFLRGRENELNKQLGFNINFGHQMKRLKLDLNIFENYDYNNWSHHEFEILKPVLVNLLKSYKRLINNAVQQCV